MNQNCEHWATLLDDFVDGALSQEQSQQVRLHLIDCPVCQNYVADVLAMRDAFPQVEDEEIPTDFVASVMARIGEQTPKAKKKTIQWQRYALSAAACLAVVVTAKLALPNTQLEDAAPLSVANMESAPMAAPSMARSDAPQPEMAIDATPAEAVFAQQAWLTPEQAGSRLADLPPIPLADGNVAYDVTESEFSALLSQVEGKFPLEEGIAPTSELCRIIVTA